MAAEIRPVIFTMAAVVFVGVLRLVRWLRQSQVDRLPEIGASAPNLTPGNMKMFYVMHYY
jgi:hypothetical protein